MTPRMGVAGQTPLRTPVRDKLNINPEEEFDMNVNDYQVMYTETRLKQFTLYNQSSKIPY